MITAGFPCQSLSSANWQGQGLDGERSGLLFEIVRLCREISTIEHVLLENMVEFSTESNTKRIKDAFVSMVFNVLHVVNYLCNANRGSSYEKAVLYSNY